MNFFTYYLNRGLIKKQRTNFDQIKKQSARAKRDIDTATNLLVKDPEWAASIVYHAMLRMGRALLFAHGYLPIDGAQHKTVVELTGKILGEKYTDLIRQFDKLRRKRNVFFYDAEDSENTGEAKKAINVSDQLFKQIEECIHKQNIKPKG